jgi:hypothetical protein
MIQALWLMAEVAQISLTLCSSKECPSDAMLNPGGGKGP